MSVRIIWKHNSFQGGGYDELRYFRHRRSSCDRRGRATTRGGMGMVGSIHLTVLVTVGCAIVVFDFFVFTLCVIGWGEGCVIVHVI